MHEREDFQLLGLQGAGSSPKGRLQHAIDISITSLDFITLVGGDTLHFFKSDNLLQLLAS